LDSLLSEESPEIQASRAEVRQIQEIIRQNFPKQEPKVSLTMEDLKELRQPIVEKEKTYEVDPTSKFGFKEVEKTTTRKKTKEEFAADVKKRLDEKLAALGNQGVKVISSESDLSPQPADTVRVVHVGRVDPEDLAKNGFKYSGDISSNTLSNPPTLEAARSDPRFANMPDTVIMDIPIDVHRKHTRIETAPEVVEPKYITAVLRKGGSENTDSVPSKVSYEGVLHSEKDLRAKLDLAMEDLDRLQMGRLIPNEMSLVARRMETEGRQRDVLNLEQPQDTQKRWKFTEKLSKEFDPIRQYFSLEGPLLKYSWGRKLKDTLGDVTTFARTIGGHYEESIVDAWRSLSYKERKWLRTVDDKTGFSNIRLLLDQVGIPGGTSVTPHTPNLEKFRDLAWRINQEMGNTASRLGLVMRFPDGKQVPYQQPDAARMLRFMTDDARKAIQSKQGEVYNAIVKAIAEWNPELANSDGEVKIKGILEQAFVEPEIKKNSALETARAIKIIPDVVTVDGKQIAIFQTDPLHYLRRAVHSQASRLAWTKVVGQDILEQTGVKQLKELTKELGVELQISVTQMRDRIKERLLNLDKDAVQQRIDEKYQRKVDRAAGDPKKLKRMRAPTDVAETAKELTTHLEHLDSGVDDPLLAEPVLSKAKDLAKKLGISVGAERQDYVDALNRVTTKSMPAEALKKLPSIAKKLKGIALDSDPDTMLSEIKLRAMEDPSSNLETILKNLSKESGGHADKYATQLVKASQGIPLVTNDRNLFLRQIKLGSQVLGTFQTSLSALRNVPQTAMLVPVYAGLKNYFGALDSVLKNYNLTKSQLIGMGAMQDAVHSAGFEKGYWLESMGSVLRNVGTTVTGLKFIAEFNNMVAGEAFHRMAKDWREDPKGIGKGDIATMKSLGLSPEEIKAVQSGQMSDLTLNKIVQEGVSKTQFVTTPAQQKGKFEHSPILQMVFSYANYSIGTGRAISDIFRNHIKPAFTTDFGKDDIKVKGHALASLVTLVGGSLGAGLTSQILVDAIKGDTTKEMDDTTMDKMAGALFEVGLLGPTQRALDVFRYGGGDVTSYATSLMPQIKALIQGVGAAWNQYKIATADKSVHDKNARMPVGKGMWEMLKSNTPMVKAVAKWVDKIAYPEISDYEEVKASSARYKREKSKTLGGSSDYPLDPDKEEVYYYVSRGDSQGAVTAAQKYYDSYIQKMMVSPKDAMINGMDVTRAQRSLRESLTGKAPINISEGLEKLDYLSKLPPDSLQKYYKVDQKYRMLVDLVAPSQKD
jgi:hypothetical protein